LAARSSGDTAKGLRLNQGIHVSIVEPGVIATPIFGKQREIPANTRYPHERRLYALFDASLKHPVSPSVVADKMVEIVQSDT
jgi:hypothetical protein